MAKFSPRLQPSTPAKPVQGRRKWRVILYNNNFHRLVDVVSWLLTTTDCSADLATEICGVCQEDGRAVAHVGSRVKCHDIAATLRLRGLQVEVDDF